MTNTSGPLCAGNPKIQAAFAQIPVVASNPVCSTLLGTSFGTCNLLAVVETVLSGTTKTPQTCDPAAQVEPVGCPHPLADARPLPAGSFPNVGGVYRLEGATYAWMYRTVQNLAGYLVRARGRASCSALAGADWSGTSGWWRLVAAGQARR